MALLTGSRGYHRQVIQSEWPKYLDMPPSSHPFPDRSTLLVELPFLVVWLMGVVLAG